MTAPDTTHVPAAAEPVVSAPQPAAQGGGGTPAQPGPAGLVRGDAAAGPVADPEPRPAGAWWAPSEADAYPLARMRQAGYSWDVVKKQNSGAMAPLTAFRKRVVDELIVRERDKHGVGVRSSGSEAPTSDYDVTFTRDPSDFTIAPVAPPVKSGKAPQPEVAVADFNATFRGVFKKEPGWSFDTNVYAEDFLYTPGKPKGHKENATVRDDEATQMSDGAQRVDAVMQDRNALVKVRKNMSTAAWKEMVDDVVGALADHKAKSDSRKQFADADTVYRAVYVKSILDRTSEEAKARARQDDPSIDSDEALADHLVGKTADGFEASNKAYTDRLLLVAALMDERAKHQAKRPAGGPELERWQQGLDKLTLKTREAKSEALLFANEPYFAAGTLYHVVGGLQIGRDTELDVPALFQSLNENYGDYLKELHHTAPKTPEAAVTGFPARAVKCSKYAYRFFDAAKELDGKDLGVTVAGVDVRGMHRMSELLFAVRQSAMLDLDGSVVKEKKRGKRNEQNVLVDASGAAVPFSKDYAGADGAEATKLRDARSYLEAAGVGSMDVLTARVKAVFLAYNKALRGQGKERQPGGARGRIAP